MMNAQCCSTIKEQPQAVASQRLLTRSLICKDLRVTGGPLQLKNLSKLHVLFDTDCRQQFASDSQSLRTLHHAPCRPFLLECLQYHSGIGESGENVLGVGKHLGWHLQLIVCVDCEYRH